MDYAHLIHTYLEGTLEEHLEEVLFAELGRNSLLRRELSAQIHITSAARRDAASITPSQFEKNAIFAELGFAAAGAQAEGAMLASATVAAANAPWSGIEAGEAGGRSLHVSCARNHVL